MNPSVVAAHKRIGLLQRFNKWQGKAMEKMQKSMDKDGVGHSSPPKRLSTRASQSLFFRAKRRRDNTQRRRKTSKARRSSSTTGLDRVQTEETQLDRAEGRVDLEEPLFEILDSKYDSTQYQDFSQTLWTPYNRFERAQLHQGQGSHTHFEDEEEEERSHKLDRVSRTQLSGALLMAVYHLQTTT
ncbi:unnamed protein product [Microthlaspi erraticum]|uniref:Uncharacterized protein n=1 Tax=Microthlaspi erraticum TaxID=1685480 RepID=A0A6D2HMX6_9BRAS|nr:unnamed protein product [Microthlaspi erraticum]